MFDTRVDADELSEFRGIFDRSNPENPFRDFGVIFVPYVWTRSLPTATPYRVRSTSSPARHAGATTLTRCSKPCAGWCRGFARSSSRAPITVCCQPTRSIVIRRMACT